MDQFVTFGLPFIAALLYVFAALSLKRAGEKGVDIWLVAFVTNLLCGVFLPACWSLKVRFIRNYSGSRLLLRCCFS